MENHYFLLFSLGRENYLLLLRRETTESHNGKVAKVIKTNMLRTLLTAILLSMTCIQAGAGTADSTLWGGISRVAVLIRQQQTDSALSDVRRLMPLADSLHSRQAMVSLHSQGAACLLAKGRAGEAIKELQAGTSVCEQGSWLKASVDGGTQQWLSLCVSMYVQLAVISEKTNRRTEAVSAAAHALPWIAMHGDKATRTKALLALGGLLTDAVGKERAKQLLTEAFYDAKALGSKDMTLMAATYLLELGVNEKLLGMEQSSRSDTTIATKKAAVAATTPADTTTAVTKPAAEAARPRHSSEQAEENRTVAIVLLTIVLLTAAFAALIVWQRHVNRRKATRSYIEGREEERQRLARELHDGVSNQLLAVQMKLSGDGDTRQALQLLDESREQVRRVSHGLMPPEFSSVAINEALASYVFEMNEATSCDITCSITPEGYDWSAMPQQQALAIYRIVQEAVTNSLRHSNASAIAIGMHQELRETTVTVSTAATPAAATDATPAAGEESEGNTQARNTGIGMRTMQQWAESIGARLEVIHGKYGHTVRLTIPSNGNG